MTHRIHARRRHLRHSASLHKQRREGIVLLVVIFVLAMVSAAGGLALRSSRNQSTQAGNNRLAVQTQYLNDAVLLDALAHIELQSVATWRGQALGPLPAGVPNLFLGFGTRDLMGIEDVKILQPITLDGTRALAGVPFQEVPLWVPPSDMVPASLDPTGTTGPRTPWSPGNAVAAGRQEVVVHFMDCVGVGARAGRDPGLMCIVEARTRTAIAASPIRNAWAIAGQTGAYSQLSHAVERLAVGNAFIPNT